MEGYWKATSINGEVYGLFLVEKYGDGYKAYRYKNGKWVLNDVVLSKLGWDDDYDDISETEAKKLMKEMEIK